MARLVKIRTTDETGPDRKEPVDPEGWELLVCNASGAYYVISAVCPHRDGVLQEGSLVGEIVTCSVLGYDFNVHTDEYQFDSDLGAATYPVKIQGGGSLRGAFAIKIWQNTSGVSLDLSSGPPPDFIVGREF